MALAGTIRFILSHPLSRGQKLGTLVRFLKWHIGARLVPGPVAVDFVNGSHLLVSPGLTGATGNVYAGLQEFEDMAFLLHFLRPGDLFVDVGANVGAYTILAAAGIGAQCIAFEPDAEAYGRLSRNVNLNGVCSLAEIRQEAVGAKSGTLRLTVGMDALNYVIPFGQQTNPGAPTACEVQSTTLDEALGDRTPAMIKIDVEGFETEVAAGGGSTLSRATLHCVLMELIGCGNRYAFNESALKKSMADLGFLEFYYDPFTRRLSPLSRHAKKQETIGNTLFVRGTEFVRQRLETASAFTVGRWKI